jgi:hypothetical protein
MEVYIVSVVCAALATSVTGAAAYVVARAGTHPKPDAELLRRITPD